jgi:hypothetical protein
MTRTGLEVLRANDLSWSGLYRVTVKNTGQTKLYDFNKWDFIIRYTDASGADHAEWLPYTDGVLGNNQWQKVRIGFNGPIEFFEPGILNPEEELVILAKLNPLPGSATTADVTVAAPNGAHNSVTFPNPGNTRLTAQSENITIAGIKYYELVEAAPADGAAITSRAEFNRNEGIRKILYNINEPPRAAKHLYPLIGISEIPAAKWTVYYRCLTSGGGGFPRQDGDVRFNIDILVREADGTLRATIDAGVASAYVDKSDEGSWLTLNAYYDFPGYIVVDENDYLEIDYYGQTALGPDADSGYMQLSIDDNTLSVSEQTRIES